MAHQFSRIIRNTSDFVILTTNAIHTCIKDSNYITRLVTFICRAII